MVDAFPLSFPCPAKLNLFLYINGRRPDGYHELQTLFQFLDVGDELQIRPRRDGQIILDTPLAGVAVEENLIYRAGRLLQRTTACPFGANLALIKRLPMGGGVGGGSSDAGTALVALNALWQTGLSLDELAQLGGQLGADVPVFVQGRSAFAQGIGDELHFCAVAEKWYVVLKPDIAIATQKIFQHPDLPRHTPKRSLSACLASPYKNDCEKVVKKLYPELEELLTWLLKYAPARLTGTGACVFAEFDDKHTAERVFLQKPAKTEGFVAKGQNLSPLHQYINQPETQHLLSSLIPHFLFEVKK